MASETLADLLRNSSLDDHDEILKTANNALKTSKADKLANQTRLVALLSQERYDDALRAAEEASLLLEKEAPLELAYTFYKAGRLDDARRVLGSSKSRRASLHLEAQCCYRDEDFARAADIYADLAASERASKTSDIKINADAVNAQLLWAHQPHLARSTRTTAADLEHFETSYNAACIAIARHEWKQAEILLKRARDLIASDDSLPEEERRPDLQSVLVQQLYLSLRNSNLDRAEQLRHEIQIEHISDEATKHIAQVNLLQIPTSTTFNPFLAHRLFQHSATFLAKNKPFAFQLSTLEQNAWILALRIGKHSEISKSTTSLMTKSHHKAIAANAVTAGVMNAAATVRDNDDKAALQTLLLVLERRPADVGLLLTTIHLYLLTNNFSAATALVEHFFANLEASNDDHNLAIRYAPGLVALLISLYTANNRHVLIKAELAKAASYWRKQSTNLSLVRNLLVAAGAALLDSASPDDIVTARDIFSTLLAENPSDLAAAAALSALSETHSDSFGSSQLPSVQELTKGLDYSALESAGIATLELPALAPGKKKRPADVSSSQAQSKPKKAKSAKLPKNYDSNKQPDPERWLPLRDRSTWRPKGKKKGRATAQGLATQGGMVSEDSRPATPSQVVTGKAGKKKKR